MIHLKKYIVIDGNPILFPTDLIHSDVASCNSGRVESAGFFVIWHAAAGSTVICSGESDSLSVGSRPEIDQKLITAYLELNVSALRTTCLISKLYFYSSERTNSVRFLWFINMMFSSVCFNH